jgi:hypothetical protein
MSPGSRFRPLHVERTGEITLPLPLGHCFPLFSPEGERAWVQGWDPQYLHPDHPSNAPGTLFRTTHNGEETLWLVLTYSPSAATARYCRFSPTSRVGTVQVHCQEEAPGRTRVGISYALTAITPAGNAVLAALTPEKYAAMLHDWQEAIIDSQGPRQGSGEPSGP